MHKRSPFGFGLGIPSIRTSAAMSVLPGAVRQLRYFGIFVIFMPAFAAWAQQVPGCGVLENAYGPFDYRDPVARGQPLHLVEKAHFTPEVAMLIRGRSGTLAGDIDYTLRAFPNHHGALDSVARYVLRGGKLNVNMSVPSADCYFERAIVFRPDDEAVRMIYANYLAKKGDREGARRRYEEALEIAPNAVEVNYNAGLFYLAEGDLLRAKEHARVAYEGGYPLPGLRKKIEELESKALH